MGYFWKTSQYAKQAYDNLLNGNREKNRWVKNDTTRQKIINDYLNAVLAAPFQDIEDAVETLGSIILEPIMALFNNTVKLTIITGYLVTTPLWMPLLIFMRLICLNDRTEYPLCEAILSTYVLIFDDLIHNAGVLLFSLTIPVLAVITRSIITLIEQTIYYDETPFEYGKLDYGNQVIAL